MHSGRVSMSNWAPVEDLVWLFEAAAQVEHGDLGYPVSAATFTTTRGHTLVECTIEPYMNSISLRMEEKGEERLRLHLWGLVDEVRVTRDRGREALLVSMIESVPLRELRLELKPVPRLTWEAVAPWAPEMRSL
jgi:hypothetical protein